MTHDKLLAEWFWTDRWMGSSAFALPIDARGLYREMLTQAWRRQAKLPNDHDQIRRMTGVTVKEWRRTWPLVERFWRLEGDSLVNDTQLEVYADAQARTKRASERGVKGAQARAHAQHKQSTSSAQAQPEHKPPSPSPSLTPKEQRQTKSVGGVGHAPLWRYPRFAVFRWMVDQLMADLGPDASDFDLDGWFQTLSAKAETDRIVLDDPWKYIKAETMAEARRRGLRIADVSDRKALFGSTADMDRGVADILKRDAERAQK